MSDEENGGQTPAQASSAEQTIPKYRLDEVLAQKRALEEQAKFWQTQAVTLQQQGQQRPQSGVSQQEQERLRRLKEENPEAFRAEMRAMKLEREMGGIKQAVASQWDQSDRMALVHKYGKNAEKRLNDVEQALDVMRSNGQYGATREQVYMWILGQERIKEEQAKANVPHAPIQTTPPVQQTEDFEAPPSNANFASGLQSGKASTGAPNKSMSEIEKDLENIEF
jgi:hypothetical protein